MFGVGQQSGTFLEYIADTTGAPDGLALFIAGASVCSLMGALCLCQVGGVGPDVSDLGAFRKYVAVGA